MAHGAGHGQHPAMRLPAPDTCPHTRPPTRRACLLALLAPLGLSACGGGGGGSGSDEASAGTQLEASIASRINLTSYPLKVYLPPDSAADRATLPVVYLLDGDSRFAVTVQIVRTLGLRVIVVAIGNEALRSRDYVPPNNCTAGGGGHVAFLDFIRQELTPFVEATWGGDPARRILLGHSHGGSFVLYALFVEPGTPRHFRSYLASDASVGCLSADVYGWESSHAAATRTLPARLHVAWATAGNVANEAFAAQVRNRGYTGLVLGAQAYAASHGGMIPAAFADALVFALA
jgi:hypothetical protein